MAGAPKEKLTLAIDDAVAQGRYANMAIVAVSDTEFLLDFAFAQPQSPAARVHSRVILSPAHAKMLLGLLGQRVAAYEERNGPITVPKTSRSTLN